MDLKRRILRYRQNTIGESGLKPKILSAAESGNTGILLRHHKFGKIMNRGDHVTGLIENGRCVRHMKYIPLQFFCQKGQNKALIQISREHPRFDIFFDEMKIRLLYL